MTKLKSGQIWRKGDRLHYLLIQYLMLDQRYAQLVNDQRWKVNCIETGQTVSVWMNPNIDMFIQEG